MFVALGCFCSLIWLQTKIWTVMPDLVIAAAATKSVNLYDKPSACDLMQVFLESIIMFELTISSVAIYSICKKPLLPMT